MSEPILINLEEVGRAINVPEEYITPPVPGARPDQKVLVQNWDKAAIARAVDYLGHYKAEKAHIAVYGHVDAWIVMAIVTALRPDCQVDYAQPNHGHARVGGEDAPAIRVMPFEPITVGGAPNPDIYFDVNIIEDQDKVFLTYRADDPNKEGMHNFDIENLSKLVLPAVGQDKDLYLFGVGAYPVQVQITNTYCQVARSVSTANHSDEVYHCAYSRNPAIQPGDTEPVRK